MAGDDEDSSSSVPKAEETDAPPPPVESPALETPPKVSSWRLPEGIEDHIETGLIHAAVGMAAGGAIGALLFRGGGMRAAGVAAGLGVAIGSTLERARGKQTTED